MASDSGLRLVGPAKVARPKKRRDHNLLNARAKKKIHPDQPGAKKLREQYGDKLFCVRYRYDTKRRLRYTTVELIIAKSPRNQQDNFDEPFPFRLKSWEDELRTKLLQRGAIWDAKKRCFFASLWLLEEFGIADRIIVLPSQM